MFGYLATILVLLTIEAQSSEIRCYACTTIDANALLSEVSDPNWIRWLENVRYVPFSEQCTDYFQVDMALRDGVKSIQCPDGVCMKMVFREKLGDIHVWRSCIPQAKEQIRSDCTKISSEQGDLEVCTCEGNLCNSGQLLPIVTSLILPLIFFAF